MEPVQSVDEKEVAILFSELDSKFTLIGAIKKPEFNIDEEEWPMIQQNKIPPRS